MKDKKYLCPRCEEGYLINVCEDDNDEWECSNCELTIRRGKELVNLIPTLQDKNKEIAELRNIIQEVHSWIVCAVISTPEDMMKNAIRIEKITRMTLQSNCRNPNITQGPKQ